MILSFAFCTMVIVTAVGVIWNRIFPGTEYEDRAPARRLRGEADGRDPVVAAREVVGPSLGYILIGLTGVALLAGCCRPAASR